MKYHQVIKLCVIYIVVLCFIFLLSVVLLFRTLKNNRSTEFQTELVYVYVQNEESNLLTSDITASGGWLLKESDGKIGVFDEDGSLIQILDTYIKTLPKADQKLLEEGIYAETKERLLSLIEDYSE